MSAFDHELIKKHKDVAGMTHPTKSYTDGVSDWIEFRRELAIHYMESRDTEEKRILFEMIQNTNEQIKQYLLL